MDVAIVGGGVFGACLAWRLSVRGHRVTLLEPGGEDAFSRDKRAAFGHAGAASGDRSRIVRALYDVPAFAASGHTSLALWTAWSRELDERLIEPTGVLYLNDEGSEVSALAFRVWVDEGLANLRALGASAEELTPAEVSQRFPGIDIAGLARAVFEPAAGFARAALATRAFAQAAFATGRVQHLPVRATQVVTRAGSAGGVAFSGGSVEAELVIVAAGFAGAALIAPFAGDLGIRRVPHWTSYFRLEGSNAALLSAPQLPCWIDLGIGLYGFPDDGEHGFKVAWHEPRREESNEREADGSPSASQLETIREAASRRFPALAEARAASTFACAYDATPDETFRVGAVPGVDRLLFVGGLSGHGFKHAPAIADSLAATMSGEAPCIDLAPFALRRDG